MPDDIVAITQLLHRYCHLVDRGPWAGSDVFTEDAVFDMAGRQLEGRAAIDAFYEDRATKGIVSRHVLSNTLVDIDGDRATATSVLRLYRMDGGFVPLLVADYVDELLRTPDGWRITSKTIIPVIGPDRDRGR